ncbi:site-specific integrase [Hydrogenophaga sp.]|uniref:site-specific integrase n=1 Tax=Hydrogenophaga sp. TaxID=1904254 RepID=UPI00271E881B|nr:site-specific integrase [Hydrogenophaga sp.]MDO9507626.1 site-specific integrase [Hydrogenophaga sp.]
METKQARPTLTALALKTAQPEDKPFELRSRRVPGLVLRVQPSGIRTFYAQVGRGKRLRLADARVATLEQAERLARDAVLAPKAFAQARAEAVTLGDFTDKRYGPWVVANRRAGKTTRKRMETIWAAHWNTPISAITHQTIDKWRTARLQQGRKPSTINRDLTTLLGCLSYAVEVGVLPSNPLHKLKPLKEAGGRLRHLSEAEVKRLKQQLDNPINPRQPQYIKPLVLLALNTGLRRGACFNLRWHDVDWSSKVITAVGTHAKTAKTQYIPMNKEVAFALLEWMHVATKDKDLVFPGRRKGKVMHGVDVQLGTLFRNAEIEDASFHTLRHTFASRLVQKGANLPTVQALMGHANIKQTSAYAHLAPGAMAAAVALLG